MTTFLSVQQVIDLHDSEKMCAILDFNKLASAVGQPSQTWNNEYLYPTILNQAAVLLFGICQAHAFEDANKRTSWLACSTFLELNEVELVDIDQDDIVTMTKAVANGSLGITEITLWLAERV